VDVLRATTTIATALASGAEAVQAFGSLEELWQISEEWPSGQRLRAGERGGKWVEGFDLGNSPLDCTPERMQDKRLFISTTNGTRALERVRQVPCVLTAALINRQAVVDYLIQAQPETVWIVGSGWEGAFALEDTLRAGAIAQAILDQMGTTLITLAANDELVAAIALFQQWQSDLYGALRTASHGQRLLRINPENDVDIRYCAAIDSLGVVPMQQEPGILKIQAPLTQEYTDNSFDFELQFESRNGLPVASR
jgi:2-phosphosulfolactate phosphatase